MKMANPRTETRLPTSLWGKANIHTIFFFFFAKTNIHRITLINIRRNYVVIVNIKHEIGDEQIREKMETNIIMTVDTMSENIFLSK